MGEVDERNPDEGVAKVKPSRLRTWAKRVGIVGIAFFAVKGIVWLVVAAVAVWGASR